MSISVSISVSVSILLTKGSDGFRETLATHPEDESEANPKAYELHTASENPLTPL